MNRKSIVQALVIVAIAGSAIAGGLWWMNAESARKAEQQRRDLGLELR